MVQVHYLSKKINGILVSSKILNEERCGTCKKLLTLRTYLTLSTRKRILAIACENCNVEQELKTLAENEKYQIPERKQKGYRYK